MSEEGPSAKEWTDEEGRRDFQRLMPWNSKLAPYRLTSFALGRVARNPRLYWLSLAVFAVGGLTCFFFIWSFHAFIYARYDELIGEIMASIIFLPLPVYGFHGLLNGYIPSNAMNYIHRGRRVKLCNVGMIVAYGVWVSLVFVIGID